MTLELSEREVEFLRANLDAQLLDEDLSDTSLAIINQILSKLEN